MALKTRLLRDNQVRMSGASSGPRFKSSNCRYQRLNTNLYFVREAIHCAPRTFAYNLSEPADHQE